MAEHRSSTVYTGPWVQHVLDFGDCIEPTRVRVHHQPGVKAWTEVQIYRNGAWIDDMDRPSIKSPAQRADGSYPLTKPDELRSAAMAFMRGFMATAEKSRQRYLSGAVYRFTLPDAD